MQKVLLINPPESGRGEYSTPPLGLLYIAATLKKSGIEVELIDGYIAGWEGVEKKIRSFGPTIVGITCHTYSRVKTLKVARTVKELYPSALVIVGGAHSTLMYGQLLSNYHYIDIAVRGEAEYTFLDICQGKELSRIDGIAYRKGAEVVVNKERELANDLDDFPFPAWEMIDISKYPSDGSGVRNGIDIEKVPCVPVVFSRGCIGTCVFCSDKMIWKRWRRRSPRNMADELELLYKKYGARRFAFNDDLFTADKRAITELCLEIVRRGLVIAFEIVTRTDCIDEALLKSLKAAGCFKINFGIETASMRILERITKVIDIKVTEKAIAMTKASGIRAQALLIVGNLGETKETINETIDFIKRAKPDDIGLANGLRIFPGTGLYDHARKIGFIDDSFWLTDYNWKIFTKENSKLRLNVFHDALNKKQKLSRFEVVNMIRHRRFYLKAIEDLIKGALRKAGFAKEKDKRGKYKVAY